MFSVLNKGVNDQRLGLVQCFQSKVGIGSMFSVLNKGVNDLRLVLAQCFQY